MSSANEAGVGEVVGDCTRELGSDAEKGRATRLYEPDQRGSWVCCITAELVLPLARGVFWGHPDQPPLLTAPLMLQLLVLLTLPIAVVKPAKLKLLLLLLFAFCGESILE